MIGCSVSLSLLGNRRHTIQPAKKPSYHIPILSFQRLAASLSSQHLAIPDTSDSPSAFPRIPVDTARHDGLPLASFVRSQGSQPHLHCAHQTLILMFYDLCQDALVLSSPTKVFAFGYRSQKLIPGSLFSCWRQARVYGGDESFHSVSLKSRRLGIGTNDSWLIISL